MTNTDYLIFGGYVVLISILHCIYTQCVYIYHFNNILAIGHYFYYTLKIAGLF